MIHFLCHKVQLFTILPQTLVNSQRHLLYHLFHCYRVSPVFAHSSTSQTCRYNLPQTLVNSQRNLLYRFFNCYLVFPGLARSSTSPTCRYNLPQTLVNSQRHLLYCFFNCYRAFPGLVHTSTSPTCKYKPRYLYRRFNMPVFHIDAALFKGSQQNRTWLLRSETSGLTSELLLV